MTNGTCLKVFAFASLIVLIGGCAPTRQARSVEKSGFLGDYSMLREGEKGEALLVYKNPKANWKSYDKVIIDPVTVWFGKEDSQLEDVSPEDRHLVATDLWGRLIDALKPDYQVVHRPGPGVMRIQAAITEAETSTLSLDTISSIVPQMRAMSELKYLATGTAGFVGKASAEVKITDAQTGELLAAAVDRRAGSKNIKGSLNTWNDVEEAYKYWANQLRYRLCQWRGRTDCVPPGKAE